MRSLGLALLLCAGGVQAQPHVYIHSVCGQIVLATGETLEGSWWMTPEAYRTDEDAQALVAESVAQADPGLLLAFEHSEQLAKMFGFECPTSL